MSNIVLLSTVYLGMPSANGICARNIVSELKKAGHRVDVICYKGKNRAMQYADDIHEIEEKKQAKNGLIGKISRIIKRMPCVLTEDASILLDQDLVASYFDKLCLINCSHKVDAVVAMFFPLEGLQASFLFKNEFPGVKTLVYELDSIGDGIANSRRQTYYNTIYEKWLKKIYSKIDSIIVMESHKAYWECKFPSFESKVRYADIPVLVPVEESTHEKRIKKNSMIYSGVIDKQYRSPTYLLETLFYLKNMIDYSFMFYSKGDCEEEIEIAAKNNPQIKRCGFVTPKELNTVINTSDFLVSIGNSYSKSVPSKLISYISYGKPIIHFSSQKEDVCVSYLKNYPACLIVNQNSKPSESAKEIFCFMKKYSGVTIPFSDIRQFYTRNEPSYSSQLIQEMLELSV